MVSSWAIYRLQTVLALASVFLTLSPLSRTELIGPRETKADSVDVQSQDRFYWIDVQPTKDLVWHPCYQPFRRECARLLVPLNHLNTSGQATKHAALALIRVPSLLPKTHPDYRGPILFNPGGPGGSGVELLRNDTGDMLAQVLGREFDLVSFDPRGVWRSTPKILFFDAAGRGEREVWYSNTQGVIRGGVGDRYGNLTGENGISLEEVWARAIVNNGQAAERGGEWLGNMNTEQTAYDMLSIINAYGREKVMFWGFSYGSVLGSTFASLFPDKVERMILDGVVDVDNYFATLWSNNLLDTPKTLNLFFETCHAAGSSCAFWAPSPDQIAANLTRILEDLITNPIPVRTATSYGILDYPRVRATIFTSLYSPWALWPALSLALNHLGSPQRDPELMWLLSEVPTFRCSCSGTCDDRDRRELELETAAAEAFWAIACADGLDIPSDVVSARSYFEDLSEESEWAGVWATLRLGCSGWPKIKKSYQGPVGANTSFPLLFIGNTADPVTPLAHAIAISKRFPGSRVLTQDSPGHASINAPSVCTLSHVKEYFLSGKLPPEGTVCPVDSSPFANATEVGSLNGRAQSTRSQTSDDTNPDAEIHRAMRDAVYGLSKAWKPFNRAFLRGF